MQAGMRTDEKEDREESEISVNSCCASDSDFLFLQRDKGNKTTPLPAQQI
jgi:hypothetical protein